ncbi:hypothetical protein [Halobacillus sp. H74]|uniref:hypothetical protein n=1 Tax=Halobacillus sp. H74 TaxID=3457436 RepID=UPI003FCC344D
MDLLHFIKDEGYIAARVPSTDGGEVHLPLNDLYSSEDLFEFMTLNPTSVQYFPYERLPYMTCTEAGTSYKVKLIKK